MKTGMYWFPTALILAGIGYGFLGSKPLMITCVVISIIVWMALFGEPKIKE